MYVSVFCAFGVRGEKALRTRVLAYSAQERKHVRNACRFLKGGREDTALRESASKFMVDLANATKGVAATFEFSARVKSSRLVVGFAHEFKRTCVYFVP